jgi:hypothetical protein
MFQDFYLSPLGYPMSFTAAMGHDETQPLLLDKLHELQSHGYTYSLAPIQAASISTPGMLLGTTRNTNLEDLAKAILNHKLVQSNLVLPFASDPIPFQLSLSWKHIREDRITPVPGDHQASAVHISCARAHRVQLLDVMCKIYDHKATRNFPNHKKYDFLPNGADTLTKLDSTDKATVAKMCSTQRTYVLSRAFHDIQDAVSSMHPPLYGGGPTLYEHLVGLRHPDLPIHLIGEVNKVPEHENTYRVTFSKDLAPVVTKILDRLYMFFRQRFGPGVTLPFFRKYVQDQEREFTISEGRLLSKEDKHMAAYANLLAAAPAQLSDDQPDPSDLTPRVTLQEIRIEIPGAFRIQRSKDIRTDWAASIASTKASHQVDSISNVKSVSSAWTLDDMESLDLDDSDLDDHMETQSDSKPKARRYTQLQEIPGFPGPVPASMKPFTSPEGAHMIWPFLIINKLQAGYNIPPLIEEFYVEYQDWTQRVHTAADFRTYPEAQQKQMLWQMILREQVEVLDFFQAMADIQFNHVL